MFITKLEDLCLYKIALNLEYHKKLCEKNSMKIPFVLGEKLFQVYSTKIEIFSEEELNFFSVKNSQLKNLIINGYKYKRVNNLNFLNGHEFENLTIDRLINYSSTINEFKLTVNSLNIQQLNSSTGNPKNILLNCIVNSKLTVNAKQQLNKKSYSIVLNILKNSFKNINELNLDVRMTNYYLKKLFKNFKLKKNIFKFKFFNLKKCFDKNKKKNCQTFIILNSLSDSLEFTDSIVFDNNFCFFHSKLFMKECKSLKSISLDFQEEENDGDKVDFLRFSADYITNNLRYINFLFKGSETIYDALCYFLGKCTKLEIVDIDAKFDKETLISGKIFKMLTNSCKSLSKYELALSKHYIEDTSALEELLLKCDSLEEITIQTFPKYNTVSELFKNFQVTLTNLQLSFTHLNENDLTNIGYGLRNFRNLKKFQFKGPNTYFNTIDEIFTGLSYSSENLEIIEIYCTRLNEENGFSLARLIDSCEKLKEIILSGSYRLHNSLSLLLRNLTKFASILQVVIIKIAGFNQDHFSLLYNILLNSHQIRELKIKGNINLKRGMKYLIERLKLSALTLTILEVTDVYTYDCFPYFLVPTLKLFPSLKELSLGMIGWFEPSLNCNDEHYKIVCQVKLYDISD